MRSLSDHLGKRGSPDLNSAWNWNLKRLNWTSAYAIINSGRLWARYSGFQGEKSNLPYFSMPRGLATSVSFPEVQNRKETESGLALWRPRMAHPDQWNCSDASPRLWPNLFHTFPTFACKGNPCQKGSRIEYEFYKEKKTSKIYPLWIWNLKIWNNLKNEKIPFL